MATPLLKALLKEKRLPMRYQRFIGRNFGNINASLMRRFVFKKIRNTIPLRTNPKANVEIHSLTCHRDIDIYLTAIKSFLRYYNNVSVVVHDDGTLTDKDNLLLKEHLPGVRIISREDADKIVNKRLDQYPLCKKFREIRINTFQIFDYNILNKTNKLISFDSDLIFVDYPKEIIDWIEKDNNHIVYNCEAGTAVAECIKRSGEKCNGDLNCGMMCYYADMVDYKRVENTLKNSWGKEGWFYAQGYLDMCMYYSNYEPKPLDPSRYTIYFGHTKEDLKDSVLIHFTNTFRYSQLHYPQYTKKLIKDLKSR